MQSYQPAMSVPSGFHSAEDMARRDEQARKGQEELVLARKEQAYVHHKRINLELLRMLERPATPEAATSAKGIGFYTHVGGTPRVPRFPHEKYVQAEPEFLPVGGPRRITSKGNRLSELDGNVERRWREVQTLVQKEEAVVKETGTNLADLTKRYVPLEKPKLRAARPQRESPAQLVRSWQQGAKLHNEISSQARRHSTGIILSANPPARRPSGDIDLIRRSPNGIATTNTYEPSRDPRLQRR